jgi:WD40 repeat protein
MAPGGGSFALASAVRVELLGWPGAGQLPFPGGSSGAGAVGYSGDGTLLLVGRNNQIEVWNLAQGQLVASIANANRPFAASQSGAVIAFAGAAGVSLSQAAGPSTVGPTGIAVLGLAVSPDGSLVAAVFDSLGATGARTYTVSAWHTADGSMAWTTSGGSGIAPQLARVLFSKDGKILAVGSPDASTSTPALLLHASDGTLAATILNSVAQPLEFASDGATLVGYDSVPQLIVWRTSDGAAALTYKFAGNLLAGGFGAGGAAQAVVVPKVPSLSTPVAFQLISNGTVLAASVPAIGALGPTGPVAVSGDGRRLAASVDANTYVWDVSSGSLLQTFEGTGPVALSADGSIVAHAFRSVVSLNAVELGGASGLLAAAVAFSPDGTLLATANTDNMGRLWSVPDGTLVQTLWHDAASGHVGPLTAVAFSPDGATVLTASTDLSVKLWRRADGTLQWSFGKDVYNSLAMSADGSRVFATAVGSQGVTVWDLPLGAPLGTKLTTTFPISSNVVLSPAGDEVWGGAAGQVLRLRISDLTALPSIPFPGGGTWSQLVRSGDGSVLGVADTVTTGAVQATCAQ